MIYLATNTGVIVVEREGDWHIVRSGLEGQQVTSVIAREGVVLAGTLDGIFRSDDEGRTWREASQGLNIRRIRWLAYHPDISDFELAGTEPASVFISRDGADSWQESLKWEGLGMHSTGSYLTLRKQAACAGSPSMVKESTPRWKSAA